MWINITLSQLCPDLIIKRRRRMKKLRWQFYLFIYLFFHVLSVLLLLWRVHLSLPPGRCGPALQRRLQVCCCLSDHHCRERLRRQWGPTSAEHLKPLWVCEAPTGSGRLTVCRMDSRPSTRRAWGLGHGTRSCVGGTAAHRHEASFMLPMRCFRLPAACSSERLTSWTVGFGVKPRSIILEFGAWRGAAPSSSVSAWFILRHLRNV